MTVFAEIKAIQRRKLVTKRLEKIIKTRFIRSHFLKRDTSSFSNDFIHLYNTIKARY